MREKRRPRVKLSGASDKKEWKTINADLTLIFKRLESNVERKLDKIEGIICRYGSERHGTGGGEECLKWKTNSDENVLELIITY